MEQEESLESYLELEDILEESNRLNMVLLVLSQELELELWEEQEEYQE